MGKICNDKKLYTARDGRVFENSIDYYEHEADLEFHKNEEMVKNLIFLESGPMPIVERWPDTLESGISKWYRVENQEELNRVNESYHLNLSFQNFPQYICLDLDNEKSFETDSAYTMAQCIENINAFFLNFGWKVNITNVSDDKLDNPDVTQIDLPRALDLLHQIIEHECAARKCSEAVEELLRIGFTAEELVDEFLFSKNDVDAVLADMKEGELDNE